MENRMVISCNKPIISLQTTANVLVSPETIIGTRGLRKKILQKGVSWQTPIPGDEVEVHYNVSLQEGEYFDSTREKGTTFRFKLGQCEVIKGWDEGIATMRKGERSIFIIPPELAYGETGCHPIIPSNSTLIFDVELISWYPIRDISGDGGIMKKITREGEGWATPSDDDEVLVPKYCGITTMDGTFCECELLVGSLPPLQISMGVGNSLSEDTLTAQVINFSALVKYVAKCENEKIISKSDESLEFSLTSGHLCPAMSTAVKTMRKGEKAELSAKFSYGLMHCENGTSTTDGTFPPYQNLIIHLELISWRTVVDIRGDKKILKKIMKKGEAFDRPNEGSLVKVVYIGKLEDGTILERRGSDEEPFEYFCGEEQIHKGLDRAVLTMREGEEAIVKISSDLFDPSEVGGLISSANSVLYEIKLIDFIKEKPIWKMDAQEKIAACETKKNDGNILFKAGKFELASKKYDKASKYVEYSHSFTDDEKLQANSLRLSCYLNNAACQLKLREYQEVSRLCTKVLELDPQNVKALFRRSQAYIRTSDLEKAEEDINRALSIDPNNKEVKIKHKELKEKQRQYVKHEAKMYSTIISRIG